jgi:tetratricopeptide (TPR) repeat protein
MMTALLLLAVLVVIGAGGHWLWRRRRRARVQAWRAAHELFSRVVDLSPGERGRQLADATLDDPASLALVSRLLAAHDATGPLDRLEGRLTAIAGGQDPAPTVDPAPGSTDDIVAGHYALRGRLGAGGMGEVYRAHDVQLGRDIALKFLAPHQDATVTARERFIREAQAAAALDHPNICTVHEIGETDDGRLYIAMALYDGETVADRIARGPLPWDEAVAITRQVARGLARAHAAGVVHRDIKPANICITSEGVVKIVDFGIAMVAGSTLGDAGPLLGTVAYMSPEQVRGESVDHRSDLWSLGVVMFEMVTGQKLFTGPTWLAVLEAIRSDDPVPFGALRGVAPLPILRIVRQLLTRDATARLASSDQLDLALGEAVAESDSSTAGDGDGEHELAPGGERRRVSAVAARLVQPDAGLIAAFQRTAEPAITRHGGRLERCDAELVVAVFGVPVAREDDQLRAARAAAELLELAGLGAGLAPATWSQLAIGIASGTVEVRVDPVDPGRYRVTGSIVECAERLAFHAAAGSIVVADPDRRLLAPRFVLEPVEPPTGGPLASGAGVARLVPRSEPTVVERTAALTPFTGRRRESELLRSALDGARGGEGRVVDIIGDAGSGKSRLAHEFRQHLVDDSVNVIAGQCQSYDGSKPYHPFIDAAADLLAMSEERGHTGRAEALRTAVERLDPALLEFLPQYAHLLSVPTVAGINLPAAQGEPARQALRDALIALFTVAATGRTLVVLLEDWHWADEASREVLRALAEVSSSFALLIVVTARPHEDPVRTPLAHGTVMRLAPLPPSDLVAMACAVLGVPALPEGLREMLQERVGGNPFYVEEICRSLVEAGRLRTGGDGVPLMSDGEPVQLPGTIQGVIGSRLDRLSGEARAVLRAAAVLGRDFTMPLLERMGWERYALSEIMPALIAPGLVRQVRVVPERAFRFAHALIHEVAYDTLLPEQRLALHRDAARAIVDCYADRCEEYASRLAWHYRQGEQWLEAARCGVIAARRSRALFEFADALATLERVDQWLERLTAGEQRRALEVEMLLDQESLCEILGQPERQGRILDRLLALPAVVEDPMRLADVHRRRGDRFTLLRDFGHARDELDLALRLAREHGDSALEGMVLRSRGLVGWHAGDTDDALHYIDQALVVERRRGGGGPLAASLNARGQILRGLGRLDDALQQFEVGLAEVENRDPALEGILVFNIGMVYLEMGDTDRAEAYIGRVRRAKLEARHPVYQAYDAAAAARIHLAKGELDRAVDEARLSVTEARKVGFSDGLARSLHALGLLLVSLDQDREAMEHLAEAAAILRSLERLEMEQRVWPIIAGAAERLRDYVRAEQAWRRAGELAAGHGDDAAVVRAEIGAARCARHRGGGHDGEVRRVLRQAVAAASQQGLAHEAATAYNSLGVLEWESGNFRDAVSQFEAALLLFNSAGDLAHSAQMHNCLASSFRQLGQVTEAEHHLDCAIRLSREVRHHQAEGYALALLGEVALDRGDPTGARRCFRASLAIRRDIRDRRGEAWMRHALARTEMRSGRSDAALRQVLVLRGLALTLDDGELLAACDELNTNTPIPVEG